MCTTFIEFFCQEISFNGFAWVAMRNRHFIERCVWSVFIAISVYASISVCLSQWTKYWASPTIITVENNKPNWKYSPIGLTMCSNFVDDETAEEVVQKLVLYY